MFISSSGKKLGTCATRRGHAAERCDVHGEPAWRDEALHLAVRPAAARDPSLGRSDGTGRSRRLDTPMTYGATDSYPSGIADKVALL